MLRSGEALQERQVSERRRWRCKRPQYQAETLCSRLLGRPSQSSRTQSPRMARASKPRGCPMPWTPRGTLSLGLWDPRAQTPHR